VCVSLSLEQNQVQAVAVTITTVTKPQAAKRILADPDDPELCTKEAPAKPRPAETLLPMLQYQTKHPIFGCVRPRPTPHSRLRNLLVLRESKVAPI